MRAPAGQEIAAIIAGRRKIALQRREDGTVAVKFEKGTDYEVHFQ
ncbi:MAG: hypothetical protein ACRD9L_17355 [Bryobacteraceae bacterium]